MVDKSVEGKQLLDQFFKHLNELGQWYTYYTNEVPKNLSVNPDIIAQMAQVEGFFQRPELEGRVTASAPIVRYLKLNFGVVMLVDDWSEKFLHYE